MFRKLLSDLFLLTQKRRKIEHDNFQLGLVLVKTRNKNISLNCATIFFRTLSKVSTLAEWSLRLDCLGSNPDADLVFLSEVGLLNE